MKPGQPLKLFWPGAPCMFHGDAMAGQDVARLKFLPCPECWMEYDIRLPVAPDRSVWNMDMTSPGALVPIALKIRRFERTIYTWRLPRQSFGHAVCWKECSP